MTGQEELLTLLHPQVTDAPALLRTMAGRARDAGLVGEGFADAVVAREEQFPTGLPTPVGSPVAPGQSSQTFQSARPSSHMLLSSFQSRKVSMPIQKSSCRKTPSWPSRARRCRGACSSISSVAEASR